MLGINEISANTRHLRRAILVGAHLRMKNVICPIVALCLSAVACLLPADAKPIVVVVSDNCRRPPNVASTYYLDALAEAGHVPVLIAHCTDEARLDEALSRVDLLLMTGGEDVDPARYAETNSASHVNAERDRFDFALMSCAVRRRLPIFGICRGHQLVNVFFGGSLVQDIPAQYVPPQGVAVCRHSVGSWSEDAVNPPAHAVAIEGGSRLAATVGGAPLAVNSHHHQCVKRLAPGFRVAARAPDGVVEAIECDTYPAAGVQFHPESLVACKPKDPSFEIARLRRVLSEIGRLCESPATNYVPFAAAERRTSVENFWGQTPR